MRINKRIKSTNWYLDQHASFDMMNQRVIPTASMFKRVSSVENINYVTRISKATMSPIATTTTTTEANIERARYRTSDQDQSYECNKMNYFKAFDGFKIVPSSLVKLSLSISRMRSILNAQVLLILLLTNILLVNGNELFQNTNAPIGQVVEGCRFYPIGENRRFERVAENLPIGSEIFKIEAHPRSRFRIEPIDNSLSDVNYFKYVDIDDKFVAIKLNQSLEDLVDRRDPQNVLKFKLTCRGIGSQEDSFLPVTVYIHDVNDHAPEFQNVPYQLEVDELTPVGLTIFRSIQAIDRDKPNTANSDITYSIVGGNDNDSFILSDPMEGILVMNKALDYDHGKREYKIQIQASDHGTPSLSSVTTMTIKVKDADDQNPIFSHEIYTASVSESAQITGKRIREKVRVEPAIQAFDQDAGINARLRYSIVLGNEDGFFEMNAQTGELFLIREIDLEKLSNPTLGLQIQASQVDNPLRQVLARVDISVQDINDNSPEFEYDMYNITVIENLPPGFTVLQVFATDSDQGENAQFRYVLHDDSGAFKIDPSSGWISVKDPTRLDRETTDKIRMQVSTLERKPNVNPDIVKRKRAASVEINLLDSNDNTPFFVGTQKARQATSSSSSTGNSDDESEQQAATNCLNMPSSESASGSSDCVVPTNLYNFNVLETASPGTQIGHVYAYDRDLGDNGRIQYFKQNDSISLSAPFDVNPNNGSIYVLAQFTRLAKKQSSYTMFVKAIDSAPIHFERRHSVAVIQINVTDINNSVPEFIGTTPFEAYVGESLPEGAFVTQIYAKDDDSITEQLEFSIVAGNDEKLFIIDSRTGKIYTSAVLDFERRQSYDLLVQVSDGVNTAVAPLMVNIIDINDQQPSFSLQFYNFTILEEAGANQTVGQMSAIDRDSGKNAQLTYSLVGEHANNAFIIDPKSGLLKTRRSLDCEVEPVIDFIVVAKDSGIPQLSGSANVRVKVDDINDWAPRFEQARYEVEIQEELEAQVDVYQMRAQDRDRDENAIIKYLIIGGNEQNLFNINTDTGLISTSQKLNYEAKREHRLQVAARNVKPFLGPLAKQIVNPAVEITIKVLDINDEPVTFDRTQYHWKLSELTPRDTIVGRLNASNPSRNIQEQDIIYWLGPVQVSSISSGTSGTSNKRNSSDPMTATRSQINNAKFSIDEKSGEIVLLEPIDRDPPSNEHQIKFVVYARDKRSINRFNASVPIVIDIVDANDNAPKFDEPIYNLEMPENLPAGTTIPTFFRVVDADSGLNGRIAGYYLNGSREELEFFHINNVTGTITLKSSLDFERQSIHKFQILAMDGGSGSPGSPNSGALFGSAQVVIQVANINEFSPKFVKLPYEYEIPENAVPGTQVGQVKAIDQDGNKITYSMSDGDTEFFAIETSSGRIYVNRQLVPRTQYSFIVRATDDGQPQNYSLGVQVIVRVRDTNDFAPTFSANLYQGTVIEKQTRSGSGNITLVQVEATDKDLQNNTLTYSIINGNEDGIFSIEKRSGEIKVVPNQAHRLDFDKRKQYVLLIQAKDSHVQSPLTGVTMVQIDVLDVNDHAPIFSKSAYVASLSENSPSGTCFFRVEADSRDTNDQITYSILSATASPTPSTIRSFASQQISPQVASQLFEIHPKLGTICTRTNLDREQRAGYELIVVANDGKFESQVPISIEVMDENDNRPQFDQEQYVVTIPYDSPPGKSVISVHANDPDAGSNGLVQYWIKNTHGLFQIDAKTGQVRLVTRLPPAPKEPSSSTNTYELRLFAQDQGSSPLIGEALLYVKLSNIENHPPKFDKFAYHVTVDENVAGIQLVQLQATDPDPGKAGKIVYRLLKVQSATWNGRPFKSSKDAQNMRETSGSASSSHTSSSGSIANTEPVQLDYLRGAFKVDKSSGRVMLVEPLDFEDTHSVELVIEARDEAQTSEAQATQAFVQVQVNDVNDNEPEFWSVPKTIRVSSSTQPNTEVIYTLQASDADSSWQGNNQIEYRLETPSKYFAVNQQTGALTAIKQLPTNLAETLTTSSHTTSELLEAERDIATTSSAIYSETLTVLASDKSVNRPLMDKVTFQVDVYNDRADDAHPIFSSNQYFVQSDQPIDAGSIILSLKAQIPNGDPIIYNISQPINVDQQVLSSRADISSSPIRSLTKRFAIDSETGKVSTTSKLEAHDSKAKSMFNLIVRATNRNQPHMFSEAGIVVRISDSVNRCPRFPFNEYYSSIPENARIDSVVLSNLVIDDVEKFAGQKLSYQITEDNSNDNFFIDVSTSSNANSTQKKTSSSFQTINVSLRVKKALDRESMPKFLAGIYTLTISASNSRCATQARVKILVEDQNDNNPQFEKQEYRVELKENSPIGHVIAQLQATDLDEIDEHRLRYFIADSQPEKDVFEMEPRSGAISVRRDIDRERAPSYLLRIMAVDQANNTGWTSIHVNVLDENDWPPTFANETFVMNTTEGPESLGHRVRLPVFDYDDGLNRQMEVYIVEGNSGNEFRLDVDEAGPLLTVVQELDWEKFSQASLQHQGNNDLLASKRRELALANSATAVHMVQIAAKDKGNPARIGRTNVLIYINDINDNPPKFAHESYYEFVEENAPIGTVVGAVKATDLDSPTNTNLTYSFARRMFTSQPKSVTLPLPLSSSTPSSQTSPVTTASSQISSSISSISSTTSSTTHSPFRESTRQPQAQPNAPVSLIAKPRNMRPTGEAPILANGSVTTIRKRIRRQVSNENYQMSQHRGLPFALDSKTGIITVARQLDTSEQQQYILIIEAFDGLWRSETQMRVVVNEVEDPRDVSSRSSEANIRYRFQVRENQADALVGVVDLKPRKLRINSQIKYSIVNSEMRQLFTINQSGQLYTLQGLDREQRSHYTFTVMLEEKRHMSKLWVAEVIVEVMDENDQIPTFSQIYSGSIKENSPRGTPVFLTPTSFIKAVDGDMDTNSMISYSLTGPGAEKFHITPTGQVIFSPLNESIILDRELKAEYKLDVHATDTGNLSSKTALNIKVEDENDNPPVFETGPLFVLIPETAKAGSKIVQVKARDRDEIGPNSEIHYKILGSSTSILSNSANYVNQPPQLSEVIRIDHSTGELFLIGQLQSATSYNISIVATDGGGLIANTLVNVTVVDVNDHKPQFERSSYNFVVLEGNYSKGALKLGQLRATDGDIGHNSQIEYLLITDPSYEASLPQSNPAAQLASVLKQQQMGGSQQASDSTTSDFPISVDVQTGELFARGPIDRELRDSFIFRVMAIDMGDPPLNSTCEVVVKVKDINDEPPRFYTDPYLALVPENLDPGHKVTQIAAFDPDSGDNGQVFYKLGEGHEGKFYIDGKDGTVWTLASLDYEQKNFYNITIIAYDRGSPSLHSSAKLWITVADMNDAVPNFSKAVYTIEVAENAKLGETIYVLNAGKGQFKYSWVQPPSSHMLNSNDASSASFSDSDGLETFTIEPNSGHIKLAKSLDSVQRNHYRLIVKAQDESEPPKFDTAEINILVGTGQGVRLFTQRIYEVSVLENQLAPLVLLDLNSTDEMIHQPVQYSITGSDHRGLFKIEPDTGRVSITSSLDRERRDSYMIRVKAETGNLNARQKRNTRSVEESASLVAGPTISQRWSASTLGSTSHSGSHHRQRSASGANSNQDLAQQRYQTSGTNSSMHHALQQSNIHLAYDETLVHVLVDDENDNTPVFANRGKPIVAAIPLEASFGYEIAKVNARDLDSGINSVIRYEIQARGDETAANKFYVDPSTGVIRSMVNFALDSGRVYTFDVKATDRDGQESGNSALVQVFVYVLPETKMVLMVSDTEPIVMEKRSQEVIAHLSNVTGFDVKMAKLEPHIEGDSPEPFSTDMFLYAVNPSLNNIVDTETLLNVFRQSSQTILSHLHSFKVRRIQGVTVQEKISQTGTIEMAIIALSSVLSLGSIVALLFYLTCKSNRATGSSNSSQQSIWDNHHHHGGQQLDRSIYSLKSPLQMSPKNDGIGSGSGSDASRGSGASLVTTGTNAGLNTANGVGTNDSEYVESLISYKRNSSTTNPKLASSGKPNGTNANRSGTRREQEWSAMNSDLTSNIDDNQHLHHHHLSQMIPHHHHNLRASLNKNTGIDINDNNTDLNGAKIMTKSSQFVASAMGGMPLKGPRARLARTPSESSHETNDPNVETHSDNEIFEDEDSDTQRQQQHHHHHHHHHGPHNHHHHHVGRADKPGNASMRSADRSMYSGNSDWDEEAGDDEEKANKISVHMIDHHHSHLHHHLHQAAKQQQDN